MRKFYAILFFLTGIFAIAGGLYTWGEGNLFKQQELLKVLIPWADIILTGPLSLVYGLGILRRRNWGQVLGLATSGIYVFGSLLVFICMFWNKEFPVYLVIPALSGAFIGMSYIGITTRHASDILSPRYIIS